MLKHVFHAAALLVLPVCAMAQPRFVPDNEIVKVGEIIFQNPHTLSFSFTNKGNKPLVITDVHPSCGCTVAEWPRTAIAPGAKGLITATYDAGIMGSFQKELAVHTNASDEPTYLTFLGRVVETSTDYSDGFPIDMGSIRMNTNYLEFDDISRGSRPYRDIKVVNTERGGYKPELMHLPPYLSAQYIPEVIPGGHTGTIRVTLDSEQLKVMGLTQTSIYLARYMGDKVSETNEIGVSAVLLPAPPASGELAPALTLSTTEVEMGALDDKSKLTQVVTLTNTGKSDLVISSLQVFNKAVGVSVGDRVLKPGKSTKMKITVTAKYLHKSKNRPRILLITNDPEHSKEIINVHLQD